MYLHPLLITKEGSYPQCADCLSKEPILKKNVTIILESLKYFFQFDCMTIAVSY